MKSLLARFALRKGVGVYVGEREIVVSKVAATMLGPVHLETRREAFAPDDLDVVLKRVLMPLLGARKRFPVPVGLGLSGQRVFFSTRPIKSTNADASPEMLLHEMFQSSSISVDDMALDIVKGKPEQQPLASIASCRRKYLTGLLASLRGCDVNPYRAEPAPCALLRLAVMEHRAPRRAKTVLRIFLGPEQGLAVLAVSNSPYVWRYFNVKSGDESNAILSVCRTLSTLSKPCGIDAAIDAVMIHGRPELRNQLKFEDLQEDIGVPTSWLNGPALDDSAIAYGLALGCVNQTESFDLARSLKPRRSLWELFPWSETAMQAVLLLCMGLFLEDRSASARHSYGAVKNKIAEHVWMDGVTEPLLQKEKKELEAKVEAIKRFMGTRVLWTTYTHDIPTRLPANATINGFEGISDLEILGKKKESGVKLKKSFLLRLAAPIKNDGTMPSDIDDFLNQLREHPLLKKDFPLVELVDLKWYQPFVGAKPTAFFTVICLPNVNKPVAKPAAEEKEKKE